VEEAARPAVVAAVVVHNEERTRALQKVRGKMLQREQGFWLSYTSPGRS